MNKEELIVEITKNVNEVRASEGKAANASKKDSAMYLDAAIKALKAGMKNDGQVKLHGFMNLSTTVVDAHIGRNPSTGEDIKIPKKVRAKAKFSNSFKDYLNA